MGSAWEEDRTSQLSRIKQRPLATDLSGPNGSADSFTPQSSNLAMADVVDLWCRPLLASDVLIQGALFGIHVGSDHGQTKVHDPCVALGIHKDICLIRCQYSDGTRFRTVTYSLEVTMDHIARVEVVDAISDIR